MKPAPFDYERPATLAAALTLLKNDSGKSKIIAGGQSLVPMMNFRVVRPDRLIDINRISELDYHRIEGSDLVIGALCRHAALKESDIVKQACPMMQRRIRVGGAWAGTKPGNFVRESLSCRPGFRNAGRRSGRRCGDGAAKQRD